MFIIVSNIKLEKVTGQVTEKSKLSFFSVAKFKKLSFDAIHPKFNIEASLRDVVLI